MDIMFVFDIVNFFWVDDFVDNFLIIFKSYVGWFCWDVSSYLYNKIWLKVIYCNVFIDCYGLK